ncbi:mitosis initiation protein fs(1)Ya [Uranotaenia lowii]|uniref:mitosis initiation protein fs(1)Ya n=1 Tax=Uranotaenia lowii TaxID=190385 RepID=UPI002478EC59|nr:mitosis initiation protein fs(1)Ya [Uranotaenia lowii]
MKVPPEVQCKTCSQVFCCTKCRIKHEDNNHQEMRAIRQICYICNGRPFPLRIDTKITPGNLLVNHILKEHLPLRCNRCAKVFTHVSDFSSIMRCLHRNINDQNLDSTCYLERNHIVQVECVDGSISSVESENKENLIDNSSSSTDRSDATQKSGHGPATAIKIKGPLMAPTPQVSKDLNAISEAPDDINEALLTPLSMINLRWKRKSRQSFDSMLCTTGNISAVNASTGVSNSPGKKLVRTTSTPMVYGCMTKTVGNESYSAIGQVSSIHSNSGSESDSRSNDITPISPTSYEIKKVRAIIRSRSKVAATPLRQVMSRSIQRAIAQHGYYSKMVAPGTQRKMSFNTTEGSSMNSGIDSPVKEALDLRTTPALKRSSSESSSGSNRSSKMVRLSSKYRSEDSSATTLEGTNPTAGNDVDQENRDNHRISDEAGMLKPVPSHYQDTPRISNGMLKKVISFATPDLTKLRNTMADSSPDESREIWATPCAPPPRSLSCSALQESKYDSFTNDENSDASSSDEVFLPPARSRSCKQLKLHSQSPPSTGKLWTIVSNVIRLASRSDVQDELSGTGSESDGSVNSKSSSSTLVQTAASFAGYLKNRFQATTSLVSQRTSSSGSDDYTAAANRYSAKRRRANTLYSRPYETGGMSGRALSSPIAKRKRIQGRQPIERMRLNMGDSGSDFY